MAFIPEQTLLFSAVDARVLTAGGRRCRSASSRQTPTSRRSIPTGGFGFEYVRVSGTIQSAGIPFLGIPALRDSGAADTVIGVAHFGVGVVLSRLVSIKPVVGFGFGFRDHRRLVCDRGLARVSLELRSMSLLRELGGHRGTQRGVRR